MPDRTLILLTFAACSGGFGPHPMGLASPTGVVLRAIAGAQSVTAPRSGGASDAAWLKAMPCRARLAASVPGLAACSGWSAVRSGIGTLLAGLTGLPGDVPTMRRLSVRAPLCRAGHNLVTRSAFAQWRPPHARGPDDGHLPGAEHRAARGPQDTGDPT